MSWRCGFLAALVLWVIPVSPGASAQLGIERVSGLRLVAEQSEALCLWHNAGVRGMPLVQIAARPSIESPRLDFATDVIALRAALEKHSCEDLRPRTGSQVRQNALYDTDNFLQPAFLLGVVRELWWVMPARQAIPAGEFDRFKEWLGVAHGLPAEFVGSLHLDGRVIRGAYRGLPVNVVTLADLPAFNGPVLVTIDPEYFVWLYDNPVKESMLAILAGFFATLRDRRLVTDNVVLSSSCESTRVPATFGYVTPWVREYLAAPERINREGPPEAWVKQGRVEYLDAMLARDQALEEAESIAGLAPASANPWFFRAQVSANRGEVDETKEFLGEAVRRDSCYATGYVVLAEVFEERRMPEGARALLEAGYAGFPEDLALGLALIGYYLKQGLHSEAVTLAGELDRRRPGYPALTAARAIALMAAGETAEAEAAMAVFRGSAPAGGMRRSVLSAWDAQTAAGPATRQP